MEFGNYYSGGRLRRLCLKELRESLRDRRTVATLFLMPILVYPLLGMVLQRLIIGTASKSTEQAYIIGVEDTGNAQVIHDLLGDAQYIAASGGKSPIEPIRWSESEAKDEFLSRFRLVEVHRGGNDQALERGAIDLAIHPPEPESSAVTGDANSSEPLVKELQELPEDRRPRDGKSFVNGAGLQLELRFRQGDARSEEATILFRRACQLVNDEQLRHVLRSLHRDMQPVVHLKSVSVGRPSDPTASIAAVIPLVLILMTITGAVYPAIDLTAGERERGTMEAMIATPAPRFALLLSKYVAVVTVSILTACANLFATWLTLSFGGLGRAIFGEGGFSLSMLLQILPILVIFAGFFSSILLALCSFAKSFKEAQAYLIPVMLVSLAPGMVTLMPHVEFTSLLAVVPLLNVLLLARDVMTGSPEIVPSVIAMVTTMGYGAAALVIAANLFGAANSIAASQGSWRDLVRPPAKARDFPEVGTFALYMAVLFPLLFTLSSLNVFLEGQIAMAMGLNAVILIALFLVGPITWLRIRRVSVTKTMQIVPPKRRAVESLGIGVGVLLLAATTWMFALEGMLLFKSWSLTELVPEMDSVKTNWMTIPLAWILLTQAVVPAVAEEFFFRGFALSALRTKMPGLVAVAVTAVLFALFHIISGNLLSLERFIPTLVLGIVLGGVALSTRSIWPGVFLHMAHNAMMLSFSRFEKEDLAQWLGDGTHLPFRLLAAGAVLFLAGILAVGWFGRSAVVAPTVAKRV